MQENKSKAALITVAILAAVIFVWLFRRHPAVQTVVSRIGQAVGLPNLAQKMADFGGVYYSSGDVTTGDILVEAPSACCSKCKKENSMLLAGTPVPSTYNDASYTDLERLIALPTGRY